MGMVVPMQCFSMQLFPMLDAVGKPRPLRKHKGQRDQRVWKPANVHSENHGD